MDLFSLTYRPEIRIQRIEITRIIIENIHTGAFLMIHEGLGLVGFQDDYGNQWNYGEIPLTITLKHLTYVLNKGDSIEVEGITLTFTRTREEVHTRAKEYFKLYVINGKEKNNPETDLLKDDFFSIN